MPCPNSSMKITVWIPAAGDPHWPTVFSLLHMEFPEGAQMRFVRSAANNIYWSWNDVVRQFKEDGDDWLFSVHNDIQFLPDTLPRLLEWDKPLVSALLFMRSSPPTPHIWNAYEESPTIYAQRLRDTFAWLLAHPELMTTHPTISAERIPDALAPIEFTSTSCCLMHRSVFEKVKAPWFRWRDQHQGGGEDFYFFQKAKKAGFQAYVDRSVIVGHLMNDIPSSAADFMVWYQSTNFVGSGEPDTATLDVPALAKAAGILEQ